MASPAGLARGSDAVQAGPEIDLFGLIDPGDEDGDDNDVLAMCQEAVLECYK